MQVSTDTKAKPIQWLESTRYEGQIDSDSGYYLLKSNTRSQVWTIGHDKWHSVKQLVNVKGMDAAKQWCIKHKQDAVNELISRLNAMIE